MPKEIEMQGYMQRVRECRGQDWNAEGYTRKKENAKDGMGENALQGRGRPTDSIS